MMSKNSIVPFLKDYLIKFLTRPFLLDTNVSRYQYSEDKADFIEEAATKMPEEYRSIFEKQTSFPAVNIGHLGVRKDMQSRGIGKQILDFILSTFIAYKGLGCQFITVDSLNNRRTNKFYASNGFSNQTNMDIKGSTRRMYLPIELYRDEDKDEDEG